MSALVTGGIVGFALSVSLVVTFLRRHKKLQEERDSYISEDSLREALIREGREGHEERHYPSGIDILEG